jgi:queuine tRNA-ribosyltransferase
MLAMRLTTMHNLWFYNTLMQRIREAIEQGQFAEFYSKNISPLGQRI